MLPTPQEPRTGLTTLFLILTACTQPPGRTLFVEPRVGGEWDDPSQVRGDLTFTTIQAAVDAAAPGDTVQVPSGTYEETVTMADWVALVGAGRGETILLGRVPSSCFRGPRSPA